MASTLVSMTLYVRERPRSAISRTREAYFAKAGEKAVALPERPTRMPMSVALISTSASAHGVVARAVRTSIAALSAQPEEIGTKTVFRIYSSNAAAHRN